MKTKGLKSIFAALACATFAFALTGCSKSEEGSAEDVRPGSIRLKLENATAPMMRVLDNETNNGINQNRVDIKHVSVFFCNAGGTIVFQQYLPAETLAGPNGKLFNDAAITTAVEEVLIISNINATTTNPTNKTQLREVVKRLAEAEAAYHNDPDSLIWGYGAGAVTFATTSGLNDAGKVDGTASVKVTPILTRIDVTVTTAGITKGMITQDMLNATTQPDTLRGVKFTDMAILNSAIMTRLIPMSNGDTYFAPSKEAMGAFAAQGIYMRNGVMPEDATPWGWTVNPLAKQYEYPANSGVNGNIETFLHATANGKWNNQANWNATTKQFTRTFYAYAPPTGTARYTFDRDGKTIAPVAIATLVGRCYSDESIYPIYYPVQFSGDEDATVGSEPMERGKHYKVTLNLKGDFSTGGGGVTDPERILKAAEVVVTVTAAQWEAVVPIVKEFGN